MKKKTSHLKIVLSVQKKKQKKKRKRRTCETQKLYKCMKPFSQ